MASCLALGAAALALAIRDADAAPTMPQERTADLVGRREPTGAAAAGG